MQSRSLELAEIRAFALPVTPILGTLILRSLGKPAASAHSRARGCVIVTLIHIRAAFMQLHSKVSFDKRESYRFVVAHVSEIRACVHRTAWSRLSSSDRACNLSSVTGMYQDLVLHGMSLGEDEQS